MFHLPGSISFWLIKINLFHLSWPPLLFPDPPMFAFPVSGAAPHLLPTSSRNDRALESIHARSRNRPWPLATPPHYSRQHPGVLSALSLGWNHNHFGSPVNLDPFLTSSLQLFFVLQKVASVASSTPYS
jgi:hypothetical protein